MQENKVGYTNPWVHQEEKKQHSRVHKTKPRVHREAKQHHRVHKKEDHRHQGTQIGHQTDDSPCAHKGHLTGLPCDDGKRKWKMRKWEKRKWTGKNLSSKSTTSNSYTL